jgi:hypothetical protein
MTVLTEDTAVKLAGYLRAKPVQAYEVPSTPRLSHSASEEDFPID